MVAQWVRNQSGAISKHILMCTLGIWGSPGTWVVMTLCLSFSSWVACWPHFPEIRTSSRGESHQSAVAWGPCQEMGASQRHSPSPTCLEGLDVAQ